MLSRLAVAATAVGAGERACGALEFPPSDDKLADYIRVTTFKTVVGDVKFGPKGNGPNRACCRCSSRASRATISLSSEMSPPRSC
jgi:hypothetical protein